MTLPFQWRPDRFNVNIDYLALSATTKSALFSHTLFSRDQLSEGSWLWEGHVPKSKTRIKAPTLTIGVGRSEVESRQLCCVRCT